MTKPASLENLLSSKALVFVGMPGAGKSCIGRGLASRLGLRFVDSDNEVEAAAGMTVEKIFAELGESAFREGEQKVIARLLNGPSCVLSTGGGAFMNEATRALIRQRAVSIWLKADMAILLERVLRKKNRPLFRNGNPAQVMQELLAKREPFYAMADIVVISDARPAETMVERVIQALRDFSLSAAPSPAAATVET